MADKATLLKSILEQSKSGDNQARTAAWNAFRSAQSDQEFYGAIKDLPLDQATKRQVWFLKYPDKYSQLPPEDRTLGHADLEAFLGGGNVRSSDAKTVLDPTQAPSMEKLQTSEPPRPKAAPAKPQPSAADWGNYDIDLKKLPVGKGALKEAQGKVVPITDAQPPKPAPRPDGVGLAQTGPTGVLSAILPQAWENVKKIAAEVPVAMALPSFSAGGMGMTSPEEIQQGAQTAQTVPLLPISAAVPDSAPYIQGAARRVEEFTTPASISEIAALGAASKALPVVGKALGGVGAVTGIGSGVESAQKAYQLAKQGKIEEAKATAGVGTVDALFGLLMAAHTWKNYKGDIGKIKSDVQRIKADYEAAKAKNAGNTVTVEPISSESVPVSSEPPVPRQIEAPVVEARPISDVPPVSAEPPRPVAKPAPKGKKAPKPAAAVVPAPPVVEPVAPVVAQPMPVVAAEPPVAAQPPAPATQVVADDMPVVAEPPVAAPPEPPTPAQPPAPQAESPAPISEQATVAAKDPWQMTKAELVKYKDTLPRPKYSPTKAESGSEADLHANSIRNRNEETEVPDVTHHPVGSWGEDSTGELMQLREYSLDDPRLIFPEGTDQKNRTVEKYADWIKEGSEVPALRGLETEKGSIKINDGHHRAAAVKMAGGNKVKVWVSVTRNRPLGNGQVMPEGVTHQGDIIAALREGKTVPVEVLAEYPDLQPKPQSAEPPVVSASPPAAPVPAKPQVAKGQVWEDQFGDRQTVAVVEKDMVSVVDADGGMTKMPVSEFTKKAKYLGMPGEPPRTSAPSDYTRKISPSAIEHDDSLFQVPSQEVLGKIAAASADKNSSSSKPYNAAAKDEGYRGWVKFSVGDTQYIGHLNPGRPSRRASAHFSGGVEIPAYIDVYGASATGSEIQFRNPLFRIKQSDIPSRASIYDSGNTDLSPAGEPPRINTANQDSGVGANSANMEATSGEQAQSSAPSAPGPSSPLPPAITETAPPLTQAQPAEIPTIQPTPEPPAPLTPAVETPKQPMGSEPPRLVSDVAKPQGAKPPKAVKPPKEKRILPVKAVEKPAEPPAPAEPKREYSSTQYNLPEKMGWKVREMSDAIDKADILSPETDPHLTVLYGIHDESPDALRKVLADQPPIRVKLGSTSVFENGESGVGDVVKIDVDGPELHALNAKIAKALPHTNTHPDYKPHVTVAYVEPGTGKKYAGDDTLAGKELVIDRITFSGKNGEKVEIPLAGKPSAEPPRPKMDTASKGDSILPSKKDRNDAIKKAEPIFAAADAADTGIVKNHYEASRALDRFFGGDKESLSSIGMGVWGFERLEKVAKENGAEWQAIESAFAPVKEKIKEIYGNSVRLYRSESSMRQDGLSEADKARTLFSYTLDPYYAGYHAAGSLAGFRRAVPTEGEIQNLLAEYAKNGAVVVDFGLGKHKLVRSEYDPAIADIYDGGEFVTDTEPEEYIRQEAKDVADRIAERDKALKRVIAKDVPVDDIVWVTNRGGQHEFVVRQKAASNSPEIPDSSSEPPKAQVSKQAEKRSEPKPAEAEANQVSADKPVSASAEKPVESERPKADVEPPKPKSAEPPKPKKAARVNPPQSSEDVSKVLTSSKWNDLPPATSTTIPAKTLRSAIPILKDAVSESKRSNIPVLRNAAIITKDGIASVVTSSLDSAVMVRLGNTGSPDGAVTIPFSDLSAVAKGAKSDQLSIEASSEKVAKIKADGATSALEAIPFSGFPVIPDTPTKIGTAPAEQLMKAFRLAQTSISTDESRFTLSVARLTVDGDTATIAATDGHRLVIHKFDAGDMTAPKKGVKIPLRIMSLASRAKLAGPISLHSGSTEKNEYLSFASGDIRAVSSVPAGTFPDVERVIPDESQYNAKATVKRADLLDLMDKAIRHGKAQKLSTVPAGFSFRDGQVSILVGDVDNRMQASAPSRLEVIGEYSPGKHDSPLYTPENPRTGLNSRYVADFLKAIDADSVDILLKNDGQAVVMRPTGDTSTQYIVMPTSDGAKDYDDGWASEPPRPSSEPPKPSKAVEAVEEPEPTPEPDVVEETPPVAPKPERPMPDAKGRYRGDLDKK